MTKDVLFPRRTRPDCKGPLDMHSLRERAGLISCQHEHCATYRLPCKDASTAALSENSAYLFSCFVKLAQGFNVLGSPHMPSHGAAIRRAANAACAPRLQESRQSHYQRYAKSARADGPVRKVRSRTRSCAGNAKCVHGQALQRFVARVQASHMLKA